MSPLKLKLKLKLKPKFELKLKNLKDDWESISCMMASGRICGAISICCFPVKENMGVVSAA